MALPASQYSVLDAKRVERLSDDTFKCFVGGLGFLGVRVEPVLTLQVKTAARGCSISLLSTELQGSPLIVAQNDRFDARMCNEVSYADGDSDGEKVITSEVTLEVDVQVPWAFRVLPTRAISASGSGVLQAMLNLMVPSFTQQLEADYISWASGDDSRKALGDLTLDEEALEAEKENLQVKDLL